MATGKRFQQRKLRCAWWEIQWKAFRQSLPWACSDFAEDKRVNPLLHLCFFVSELHFFFSGLQKFWHLFGKTFVDFGCLRKFLSISDFSSHFWDYVWHSCLSFLGAVLVFLVLKVSCILVLFLSQPSLPCTPEGSPKTRTANFSLVKFSVIPSSRQLLLTQTRSGSSG